MSVCILSPSITPASPLLDGARDGGRAPSKRSTPILGARLLASWSPANRPRIVGKSDSLVPAVPQAFPAAELGKATRLAVAPLVLLSHVSGKFYCSDPSDRGKNSQFGGVVVRCCEVQPMTRQHAQEVGATVMAPAPDGLVFAREGQTPLYALKVIRRDAMRTKAQEQGRPLGQMIGEDPMKEIAALQRVSAAGGHPNVEQLVEALCDDEFLYKITRWYGLGEAFDHVPLPERQARVVVRQVLRGVAFLHSLGICHRDVSLENILVERGPDGQPNARLVDLGMAVAIPADKLGRRLPVAPQGRCGKPATMAPEIYHNSVFDGVAADVFSCGSVLYMLLTGVQPWGQVGDALYDAIAVKAKLAPLLATWGIAARVSAPAIDLLQRMLRASPKDRLATVEAVLAHPWFAQDDHEPVRA